MCYLFRVVNANTIDHLKFRRCVELFLSEGMDVSPGFIWPQRLPLFRQRGQNSASSSEFCINRPGKFYLLESQEGVGRSGGHNAFMSQLAHEAQRDCCHNVTSKTKDGRLCVGRQR